MGEIWTAIRLGLYRLITLFGEQWRSTCLEEREGQTDRKRDIRGVGDIIEQIERYKV